MLISIQLDSNYHNYANEDMLTVLNVIGHILGTHDIFKI